jgi:hypothetical protein
VNEFRTSIGADARTLGSLCSVPDGATMATIRPHPAVSGQPGGRCDPYPAALLATVAGLARAIRQGWTGAVDQESREQRSRWSLFHVMGVAQTTRDMAMVRRPL